MAAKCGPAVSNLSAMAAEVAVSGRFGEPGGGPEPGSTKKDQNRLQTEQFCFMKAGLTWAGLGRPDVDGIAPDAFFPREM